MVENNSIENEINVLRKSRKESLRYVSSEINVDNYDSRISHLIYLFSNGKVGLEIYNIENKIDSLFSNLDSYEKRFISKMKIKKEIKNLVQKKDELYNKIGNEPSEHFNSLMKEEYELIVSEATEALENEETILNQMRNGLENGSAHGLAEHLMMTSQRMNILRERISFGNEKLNEFDESHKL